MVYVFGMKLFMLWAAFVLSSAAAHPALHARQTEDHAWRAPSPTDRRAPCPMLNTLANHGYLPRDGANISMEVLIAGLKEGVNLAQDATLLVGEKAMTASTTGSPQTFHLDDINKHGVIEHDGSLSRNDVFFGDNHSFNSTIWAQTASHFTKPTIDISTVAKTRRDRIASAKAANPNFALSVDDTLASLIESALYLTVMSNGTGVTGVVEWVKVMFQEERLPIEEGWTRPKLPMTAVGLLGLAGLIGVA